MAEIDHGIPIPAPRPRKKHVWTKSHYSYPYLKMAVGNSFRMRARYIRSAKQSVKIVNEKLTSKFTAREMVDENGVVYEIRVWRIS